MHKPKLRKLDREQRRKLPKNKRNGSSEFFRVSRSKIVISLGTVTKLKCSEHSRQKDSFMFKKKQNKTGITKDLFMAQCFNSPRGDHSIHCRFVVKYYKKINILSLPLEDMSLLVMNSKPNCFCSILQVC